MLKWNSGYERRRAGLPGPVSADPGRPLGGAGDGRDQEGLVDDEPGAGRDFDRGEIGEEDGPIELDRHRRGIARGERSSRGPAAGRAVAGATTRREVSRLGGGIARGTIFHDRGMGGHVMADEPIAAARLGRAEGAEKEGGDECQHRHDPAGS